MVRWKGIGQTFEKNIYNILWSGSGSDFGLQRLQQSEMLKVWVTDPPTYVSGVGARNGNASENNAMASPYNDVMRSVVLISPTSSFWNTIFRMLWTSFQNSMSKVYFLHTRNPPQSFGIISQYLLGFHWVGRTIWKNQFVLQFLLEMDPKITTKSLPGLISWMWTAGFVRHAWGRQW